MGMTLEKKCIDEYYLEYSESAGNEYRNRPLTRNQTRLKLAGYRPAC